MKHEQLKHRIYKSRAYTLHLYLLHHLIDHKIQQYIIASCRRHTRPGMVKIQMALERAVQKTCRPPTERWNPTIGLLGEVLIVVLLRWNLHEVAFAAGVEAVVNCGGSRYIYVER